MSNHRGHRSQSSIQRRKQFLDRLREISKHAIYERLERERICIEAWVGELPNGLIHGYDQGEVLEDRFQRGTFQTHI